MNVYIAFSIHGSNRFLVATKDMKTLEYAGMAANGFSVVNSRRPDYKVVDGRKLHWDKLLKRDGTPHTSPAWVLRRFNELEAMGWKIVGREQFVEHFYKGTGNHAC